MALRHKSQKVPTHITYALDGLQAGDYTSSTPLRDKTSHKVGSFQTALDISPQRRPPCKRPSSP